LVLGCRSGPSVIRPITRSGAGPGAGPGAGAGSGRRRSAAERLARLAAAGVPGADPDEWYGLAPVSSTRPLRGDDDLVRVSPSRVEQFDRCALRWLLESAAGGTAGSSTSQSLGTLVHELAEAEPDGDLPTLRRLLDERIGRLGLGQSWVGRRQREQLERMIAKFAQYVAKARAEGRELVAVEQDVAVQLGRALVRGQVDRLERDAEGRLVVVDLKTGGAAPSKSEVVRHAQLGVYQAAVEEGGFERVAGAGRESGGAMLVQLGVTKNKNAGVQQQRPIADDLQDPQWAHRMVAEVADGMAGAGFEAGGNPLCRTCKVRRSCPLLPEGRQVGG
jgi:RecB family exonuclease